jgi:hypothetical protein
VRLPVDGRFIAETEAFALRFTCDDCLHYLAESGRCAHFWPNAEHQGLPEPGQFVVFCKEFEVL